MYGRLFATLEMKRTYPIPQCFKQFTFLYPNQLKTYALIRNGLIFRHDRLVALIARTFIIAKYEHTCNYN